MSASGGKADAPYPRKRLISYALIDFCYRDWGAQTEADLLWLVFMHNSQGYTWCGERRFLLRSHPVARGQCRGHYGEIDDPVVTDLWREIQRQLGAGFCN